METKENKEFNPLDIKKQVEDQQQQLKNMAIALMPKEALEASESAKKLGLKTYVVQIVNDFFVYKTIKRSEWKVLLEKQMSIAKKLSANSDDQDIQAMNAEHRLEEEIAIVATIWPQLDQISIKSYDAGQIETLATQIKLTSGFGQQPVAIQL